MHNACTPLNSMSFLMITHCLNQLRSIDCLNQCRAVQNYTTLFKSMSSSPSDPMHQTLLSSCCLWLVTTTTYAHTFERGRFPYDAQEWENLEMRGWGRCLRKTKLHFVRKDKFIDIDFGEHKRLTWDSGRLLLLADLWWKVVRKTKVLRKQSGKLLQLQWEVVSSIFAQSV